MGVVADSVLGERERGRPARAVERVAQAAESTLRDDHPGSGVLCVAALAGGATVLGAGVEWIGRRCGVLGVAGTAAATWLVVEGAGLARAGTGLAGKLEAGDLPAVRNALAELDPRCSERLDDVELSRASVETVAEHSCETVVGPLLWGAFAGVPGLLGARAVAVLRRRLERERVGCASFRRFAALLAELVALVPTRVAAALTVSAAPVVGGSAASAWQAWRRDTLAHPSPNAGRVEAAYAGALEIRLGGRTVYPPGPVERPVLGVGRNPDAGHVTRAVELSRVVGWMTVVAAAIGATVVGRSRHKP